MIKQWKAVQLGLLLVALPLAATAAVSASQWVSDNAPIELSIDEDLMAPKAIGLDRVHAVRLNSNGIVEGRVAEINPGSSAGLANLNVFFLSKGKIVQEAKTAADGSFAVAGLQEGIYSFIATGENAFVAYGVQVVSEASVDGGSSIEVGAVSPDSEFVKQMIVRKFPEQPAKVESDLDSINAAPAGANRVRLVDGTLRGTVHALVGGLDAVRGAEINLIKGDKNVASISTEDGNFEIKDLEPGVYSIVATGRDGFAALSFEAVSTPAIEPIAMVEPAFESVKGPNADPFGDQEIVMQEDDSADSLVVGLTPGNEFGYINSQVVYETVYVTEFLPVEYIGESVNIGGAVGGSYGSTGGTAFLANGPVTGTGPLGAGAGRFGGGRLGRLALIAGSVVGIVAIADDNEAAAASNVDPS
ncbi:MAG: carboxypeptidase-like regulatory domain-containing protein [Planctomycetota bacterium]